MRALTSAVGKGIGMMHDCDVIHGDLTTSNIMVRQPPPGEAYGSAVFIDFGLGAMKATPEDKAVDLYVLERAFISTHPNSEAMVRKHALIMLYPVLIFSEYQQHF